MRFVGYAMGIEIKGLMVSVVLPTVYAKINHPKNFVVEFFTIFKILLKQGFLSLDRKHTNGIAQWK